MRSHPDFFFMPGDDSQTLTAISDDYARLGRKDIVKFCADLRDPNKQKETFLKLKDLYEKTQDIDIGTLFSFCYDQGLGTMMDKRQGLTLDLALMERGCPLACFSIANECFPGGMLPTDPKEGHQLYSKALNQQNMFSVFSFYGGMLLDGNHNRGIEIDENTAIKLLTQAADNKQSIACLILCQYYHSNLENNQLQNVAENLYKYSSELSNLNHATGNYYLALCYAKGIGVEENIPKYIKLLSNAAARFSTPALAQLAFDYLYGIEGFLDSDPKQGIELYMKALYGEAPIFDTDFEHFRRYADNAEFMALTYKYCCNLLEGYSLGDAASCLAMGRLFENGLLVQQDLNRALKCYKKAFEINKNQNAADHIATLGAQGVGEVSKVAEYLDQGYGSKETKVVKEHIKKFTTVFDGLQASLGGILPDTLLRVVADYAYTPEVLATGNNGTTTDAAGNEDPDKAKAKANAAR